MQSVDALNYISVSVKIRQEVVHACQKPTELIFISNSEKDTNHITILSLSFSCCTFKMDII